MQTDRYIRQTLLPPIGQSGRDRLARSAVLLIGCGALGCVIADQLVRAGVGALRLADRDLVELSNLQRQVLFDEADARQAMPKAMAAARRLSAVNSTIRIEPLATDVNAANIPELAGLSPGARRVDLILDGTDNIATRYLINDLSVKHAIPWVYGACVGTEGRSMAIVPGHTPCLRCLFPTAPHPSEIATCDTAGVLGPAAAVVASLQTTAAIRILTGQWTQAADCLWTLDLWASRVLAVQTHAARRADCPCCGQRRFDFLDSPPRDSSVTLCGRDAVQVASDSRTPLSLDAAAQRLRTAGSIQQSKFLLRCHLHEPSGIVLSLFPDGRLIVHGTSDPARAKAIYARFIGM